MDTSKYEITDRHNYLQKYNFFLKNMETQTTLQELIKKILQKKSTAKIFDVGCGDAGALHELKKKFGKKIFVCGIDLLAVNKLDEFILGDAVKEAFPKGCDLIVSFRALHEIANLEKIFKKMSKSLQSGAKAVLSIRCQQRVGEKTVFHGNLEKKDLDFLKKISKKQEFENMQVLIIEIKQKLKNNKKIVAGINVFLVKN